MCRLYGNCFPRALRTVHELGSEKSQTKMRYINFVPITFYNVNKKTDCWIIKDKCHFVLEAAALCHL